MRARPAVAAAVATLAAATGAAAATAADPTTAAASPAPTGPTAEAKSSAFSRLLVSASEYRLTLSRGRVARGPASIQLLNKGEDDHDLRLRRISRRTGRPTARWALTAPGRLSEVELRLSSGRYRLWCSLPGHERLGMQATLRVSRVVVP